MAGLKSAFEAMGFTKVRPVLASGNVIFESARQGVPIGRTIALKLEKALGFPVAVIIRTVRELRAIVGSEPFQAAPSGPGVQLYVTFLEGTGKPGSLVRLPASPQGVRILRIDPGEIYGVVDLSRGGRTPDLMRFLDRTIGRGGTTRNWRTVLKLVGEEGMTPAKSFERKLTDLPNIGKTTAAKLEKIGIKTAEEFLERDPYDVFHTLLKKVDPTLCRCALAGIVGAKKGEPWHKVTKKSAAEYEKRHPRHKWGPC